MDRDSKGVSTDINYNPSRDSGELHRKDTRKTRLTLKQINELRKASDTHILEQQKELEFVAKMYKTPAAPPA